MTSLLEDRKVRVALLILGLSALLVVAVRFPSRGDELRLYGPAFEAAARDWPRLDRGGIIYPISPIYLWIAGGLHGLPGGSVIWLRLLSLSVFGACAAHCLAAPRFRLRGSLLILLNPFLLVYCGSAGSAGCPSSSSGRPRMGRRRSPGRRCTSWPSE